jgi:hypothetical protein
MSSRNCLTVSTLAFLFCVSTLLSNAQPNLVFNSSFELYTICPTGFSQVSNCSGWRAYTDGTPDLYNSCASGSVGVPNNAAGSQLAASGSGYVGGYTMFNGSGAIKEYVAGFMNPLQIGRNYEVSISASLGDNSGYATDDLGVFLYKNGPSYIFTGFVALVPYQVSYSSYGPITDKTSWTRLTKYFVADSAYNNIVVGGFKAGNSLNKTKLSVGDTLISYYYFDSIVVKLANNINLNIQDSVFCVGDSVHVPYTVLTNNYFNSNNIFTLQLSDATGSFSNPVNIGSVTSNTSGTIHGIIPVASTQGTSYHMRIVASAPGDTSLNNTPNIKVYNYPTGHSAGSNGPVCLGNIINLNSTTSTSGVTYAWAGPGNYTSSAQNPVINPSAFTDSGDYVVTITSNGCPVNDTTHVSIKPLPQNLALSSNSNVCPGLTLNLYAVSTTPNLLWQWTGPAGFSSALQNPNRSNMQASWAGTYTCIATLNGCAVSAVTNVTSNITTPTPVVTANSPVCYGGTLNLTASAIPGALYIWSGPNNFHSNIQNASRTNMGAPDAGVYSVTANINGCVSLPSSTQSVTLIAGPSVSAYASPSSTICAGASVALVAIPTNIGTNPAIYQWYLNNNAVNGATNGSYVAPAPGNGDAFYVQMTAGTACNTPISSNSISITTVPATPPPVTEIIASPGTEVWPYLNVAFSISSLTNGGTSPTYQWKLNGQNVNGATKNTWSITTLKDGDSVCLWVTSSDQCATPKSTLSNCLGMKVPTNITNPLQGDLGVYPNPASKQLTIDGATIGATIQVNNIIGQTIYKGTIQSAKETINTSLWTPGGYLLHLTNKDGNSVVRRVVKE